MFTCRHPLRGVLSSSLLHRQIQFRHPNSPHEAGRQGVLRAKMRTTATTTWTTPRASSRRARA